MNVYKSSVVALSMFTLAACTLAVTDGDAEGPEPPAEQLSHGEGGGAAEPRIEPALIQQAVRTHYFPKAKACYQTVLADEPSARGKTVLRFVIVDGAAEDVVVDLTEGNLNRETFLTCMRDALTDVPFPVVEGNVKVSYPIDFGNDD